MFFSLAPAERAWSTSGPGVRELWWADGLAMGVVVVALLFQAVGDEQLRRFRRAQYGEGVDLNKVSSSKAICRTGLWAWSRHPNYFGEALFWTGIALIGYADDPDREWYLCWYGAAVMMSFFHVSAWLTDRRMLVTRGPAYEQVMRETSALVPLPPALGRCMGPACCLGLVVKSVTGAEEEAEPPQPASEPEPEPEPAEPEPAPEPASA